MPCRGCLRVATGLHAVMCCGMYRQCRGEWKLARAASRCGNVVYPAGKWRHCVCCGRASTRPYIACVWGACEGAHGGWAVMCYGDVHAVMYMQCRGACGLWGNKKGRPGWVALILRGCVNYLTTNLAPFWIAIPLKFLDTF